MSEPKVEKAETLESNIEAVERALGKTRARIAKGGETPEARIAAAIEGRDPAGFTEVFAADVVAVAAKLTEHTERTADIALAAVKNLKGLREHLKAQFVICQPTGILAELLESARGPSQ